MTELAQIVADCIKREGDTEHSTLVVALSWEIHRLSQRLAEMEQGYRERCSYCRGHVDACERAPSGCMAQKARAAMQPMLPVKGVLK